MLTRRAAVSHLLGALASAALLSGAVGAVPRRAPGFGVAKWEAGTCNGPMAQVKECEYTSPHSAFYTQAAGHPVGAHGLRTCPLRLRWRQGPARRTAEAHPRRRPPGPGRRPADARHLLAGNSSKRTPNSAPSAAKRGSSNWKRSSKWPGSTVLAPPLTGRSTTSARNRDCRCCSASPSKRLADRLSCASAARRPRQLGERTSTGGQGHSLRRLPRVLRNQQHPDRSGSSRAASNHRSKTLKSKLFFNGHAGRRQATSSRFRASAARRRTRPPTLKLNPTTGEIASTPTVPPVGRRRMRKTFRSNRPPT